MIWFVIIAVIVIIFYGIISIGTSRKSVSMESENEEELSIPLSITVTSLSEKNEIMNLNDSNIAICIDTDSCVLFVIEDLLSHL